MRRITTDQLIDVVRGERSFVELGPDEGPLPPEDPNIGFKPGEQCSFIVGRRRYEGYIGSFAAATTCVERDLPPADTPDTPRYSSEHHDRLVHTVVAWALRPELLARRVAENQAKRERERAEAEAAEQQASEHAALATITPQPALSSLLEQAA
jgi:hypothetical protein